MLFLYQIFKAMKKLIFLPLFLIISFKSFSQTICDPNGNVVLFSNYDGGILNINVDVNIPNLKIGVVSYEMVTINLSGAFAGNITAVQFAGYTTTTHHHCNNSPSVTSIVGAPPGTDTLVFMPNSPVTNSNGYYIIICNTSCDTASNQGGCNTPDQVAAYFQQVFGGSLRFHLTQYGCWNGSYNLSSGGNCCVGAVSTAPVPVSAFQSSDTTFCEKQCVDFTDLSTNNPTSWQWFFPGADSTTSNLQNPQGICYSSYGSFDVTLVACNVNGCDTFTVPDFIREYQSPPVPVITGNADTLFATTANAYQWYNSTGPISGANNFFYVYNQQGSYFVIVTDSNGCASSSTVIYTGMEEWENNTDVIHLYPNPSTHQMKITLDIKIKNQPAISIFNTSGDKIYQQKLENKNTETAIDVSTFPAGLYMVRLDSGNNYFLKKFIVYH